MINFLIFAISCVAVLTCIVIFGKLPVRKPIAMRTATIYTMLFVVVALASWVFVTSGASIEDRILSPLILPSPGEVADAFPKLHFEQGLARSALVSFKRVAYGFLLGSFMAFCLGVYMATFPPIAAFFKPLSLVSSYVPIVVFVPLTLAWWGCGETQKVGFLFIACFVALLPVVTKAISDVDNAYLETAKTKGASQWQLVTHVLVPVAMADIWGGLRMVYGIGWTWIILAEVVNAQSGLGYLMFVSERRGHTNSTFAIIIVIVIIAILCDKIWVAAGKYLFPYRSR